MPGVGFIGLGQMGLRMAQNLQPHTALSVFDVVPAAVAEAIASASNKDTTQAESPAEVAANSDVIITMLPSSPHVREVYYGDNGVFKGVRANTLLVDASTIDPATARAVAADAVAKHSAEMVDAPVSGGITGAAQGTLTFMVGGPEASVERAKGVLQHMGKNIVHCGESGTGQVAKICNNLLLGISMIGTSEAYNLGVKLGMDPEKLAGVINTSSGRCWSSDAYNPVPGVMDGVPASRGYEGGFATQLMAKDLGLAITAAADAKASLPLGEKAASLYASLEHGKDFGIVYQLLKDNKIP